MNGEGPMLFKELMDRSTDNLHREVERRLNREASAAARNASGWVSQMIDKAYAEGVRDGYVQGVQAAEQQRAQKAA